MSTSPASSTTRLPSEPAPSEPAASGPAASDAAPSNAAASEPAPGDPAPSIRRTRTHRNTRLLRIVTGIGRRLLSIVAVLWMASTLAFVVLRLAGGDPVAAVIGSEGVADQATRDALTKQLGLDRPIIVQYVDYLGGLLTGDLGTSYAQRKPVSAVLADQIAPTVELALAAAALAVVLALAAGLLVSRRNRVGRVIVQSLELLLVSTPTFWLGIVLLTVFGFTLRWFPVFGNNGFASLVLPAITLALPLASVLAQVIRESVDKTEDEPFVLSVRARGASELRVSFGHVLKHAAGPALNVAGLFVGGLLGGAVLVESVFGRSGLGQVALSAVLSRDMPVVMAVVLLSALVYVVVNSLLDVLHSALDPRIRPAARTITPAPADISREALV